MNKLLQNYYTHLTTRESFLISLLNKMMKEYKTLLDQVRRDKPFKIIEISNLSSVPGETQFTIQVSHKNCFIRLSAAEIINSDYDLNEFNEFNAKIITLAAQGRLVEFLKFTEYETTYHIISKRFDKHSQQHIFTLESKNKVRFNCSTTELSNNKELLSNISTKDIYDVGYSQGVESILKENSFLSKIR